MPPIYRLRVLVPLCLFAALSGYGCDDNGTPSASVNGVGPSPLTSTGPFVSRLVQVVPAFIDPVPIAGTVCPNHQPFLAPMNVVFRGDGRSDLNLTHVQMQFVDSSGTVGGLMTVPQTGLVLRFGSTALPSFGTRAFPFSFPFSCVGLRTGTLTVVVVTGDSRGRETSSRMLVDVRGRP